MSIPRTNMVEPLSFSPYVVCGILSLKTPEWLWFNTY